MTVALYGLVLADIFFVFSAGDMVNDNRYHRARRPDPSKIHDVAVHSVIIAVGLSGIRSVCNYSKLSDRRARGSL
jgi:hypothetical protein